MNGGGLKINGSISIPWKVCLWAVVNLVALGGLLAQVRSDHERVAGIDRKVDFLIERALSAGPPAPVGWDPR